MGSIDATSLIQSGRFLWMALVALSSCLPRIHPQSTREGATSVSGSFGEPISHPRLDAVRFKSSPALCECSLSCSSRIAAGRESPAWGNSSSEWAQQSGRSRAAVAGRPARAIKINRESAVAKEEEEEDDEEDDTELCPVECVREFKSRSEFDEILRHAKRQKALVVVDFFKTACGSCRYIETGFVKLCKGAGNTDVSVIFLKHNVG